MGKVTKRKEGRIREVEFEDGKIVSLRFEGQDVYAAEIGFFDAEVRQLCKKPLNLYEDIAHILEHSRTVDEAAQHLSNLYLPGQRRTKHEKDVAEHEELANAMIRYTLHRAPLKKWDSFQQLIQRIYGSPSEKRALEPGHAKDAILETLEAYTDPDHPDHRKVVDFLLQVPFADPLRYKEDGLWILRDMTAQAAALTAQPEEFRREFRAAVRGLRLTLGSRYYDPVPYVNDVDTALDWLDAAEKSIARHDLNTALGFCSKAMDAAPNLLESYYKAAECYILKGDYTSATGALDSVRFMPMADKIYKHRSDFYAVYLGLCAKMPNKFEAEAHREKLKALADKHSVVLPGL